MATILWRLSNGSIFARPYIRMAADNCRFRQETVGVLDTLYRYRQRRCLLLERKLVMDSNEVNDLLRKLVSSGNVSRLLRVLKYGGQVAPEDLSVRALTRDELKLFHTATAHLEFVERYGTDREDAEEGGLWHFAFPEEFDAWLAAGRPGLSDAEVRTLLDSQ